MNKEDIKKLLLKGERITLEAKLAEKEVPKSIWDTYSAFANTIGGTILLGIDEHRKEKDPAKRYEILGVEDADKIKKDFWNTINSNKVNENILVDSDVEVVNMEGVQIVCIRVPQADWRVTPIYLNGNVYRGTYRRNNEGDYHCTEAQVKAMIRDSNADGNDSILIEYYGMDDIDPDSLRQYRTEFRQENSTHVWNRDDDKTFLRNLGGYTEERQTGKEGLTLAGLMMFGKGLAIRLFYTYPFFYLCIYLGFPGSSTGKGSTCNAGDLGLIPGLGRSPGGGNGYSLQYSCLENSWTEEPGRLQSMESQRVGHS